MNKKEFIDSINSYLNELGESEDIVSVVTKSGKELSVKAKDLTDEYLENNEVEDIVVEDDLENILPGLIEIYNEEGIRRIEEEIFPVILHPYDDKTVTLEIKLIGSFINSLNKIDDVLGEDSDVRFVRPNMNLEDYLLEVNLHDLEKYKGQFTDEEYSRFIDFIENNIDELIDVNDIIDQFVKRFHVEELTDPAND